MSVQFVCQRGVGGLFVFVFLIRAGTPMYSREGGPVVHEHYIWYRRCRIDTRCSYAILECSKYATLTIMGFYGNYFFTLARVSDKV